MPITLTEEYSRALAALEGAEFQAEVTARLATVIIGFQTIPSKPHGDAGLDGLSHNGTRGYCCYGLEHNGFKNNRSREQAVIKKFAGDLRRLFELETKGSTLVPWIFDYYTKLGFSPAHKIHKIHALRRVSASSALSSLF